MNTLKSIVLGLSIIGLISCGAEDNGLYNHAVVSTYSSFIQSLSNDMKVAANSSDSVAQMNAIERLNHITDSCLLVMSQLQPKKEALDFHQSVDEVYKSVKDKYIPVLKKVIAYKRIDSLGTDYNTAVLDFSQVSHEVDSLQKQASLAQKAYAEKLDYILQ